jgi:hypothetical protein
MLPRKYGVARFWLFQQTGRTIDPPFACQIFTCNKHYESIPSLQCLHVGQRRSLLYGMSAYTHPFLDPYGICWLLLVAKKSDPLTPSTCWYDRYSDRIKSQFACPLAVRKHIKSLCGSNKQQPRIVLLSDFLPSAACSWNTDELRNPDARRELRFPIPTECMQVGARENYRIRKGPGAKLKKAGSL